MILGIILVRHGHGVTVILGIGMHGIRRILGVGTTGAGIHIGRGLGALLGVLLGDSDGVRHTVPVGDPHVVRRGAGAQLRLGDRQLLPAHLARITT